ncbi:MAG: spondin domain-containing protein, partial [Rhodothermia bacterium]
MRITFLFLAATLTLFTTLTTTANGQAHGQQAYFKVTVENVGTAFEHHASVVFAVPEGSADPAPIGPGGVYTFTFDAAIGQSVSFATMFIPSNDLFYAPGEDGISLYADDGTPVEGDVTDQIMLWDAGTEINQEPGVGPDQAQRQSGPNTGDDDPDNTVRLVNDGFTYPDVADVVAVSVMNNGGTNFTVRIKNVSTGTTLKPSDGTMQAVPLAPGAFVVHSSTAPLFTSGEADRDLGLEAVAEDGNPVPLSESLGEIAGVTQVLAPVAWVVHTDTDPFFTAGEPARDNGLEMLAQDGGPGGLAGSFRMHESSTGGASVIPVGGDGPGPIGPGGSYSFTISARPG